jgi:hypothetical protein
MHEGNVRAENIRHQRKGSSRAIGPAKLAARIEIARDATR